MDKTNIQVEVCLSGVFSVKEAAKGGADRIELCGNLQEGGTTPSLGTIHVSKRVLDDLKTSTKLFVMIRPRSGDFCYSDLEIDTMVADIQYCKDIGVDGIVLGLLQVNPMTSHWSVDVKNTQTLVNIARPMSVTFHRAFDMISREDLKQAIEDIVETGVDRLLTSGLADSALGGIDIIEKVVIQVNGRIEVVAGAGIDGKNVKDIIQKTNVNAVHVGSSVRIPLETGYPSSLDPSECKIFDQIMYVTERKKVSEFLSNVQYEKS